MTAPSDSFAHLLPSLTELQGGFRSGRLDPVQLLEQVFERIEACNGALSEV